MRKKFSLCLAALLTASLSLNAQIQLSPSDFTVVPAVLETVGMQIPVTIGGKLPKKVFAGGGSANVQPVLRYDGGEVRGQMVPVYNTDGGKFSFSTTFNYEPEMEHCALYLVVTNAEDVKVAEGTKSTSALLPLTLTTEHFELSKSNYNGTKTQAELYKQTSSNPSQLTADELLYVAELHENPIVQENVCVEVASLYPYDYRAYNNLGAFADQRGDTALAHLYVKTAYKKDATAPEVNANCALVEMRRGNMAAAADYLSKATAAQSYDSLCAIMKIADGRYAEASKAMKGKMGNTAALAHLLAGDNFSAAEAIYNAPEVNGLSFYLKAIVAARIGQADLATLNLRSALEYSPSLKARAASDYEFAGLANNAEYKALFEN